MRGCLESVANPRTLNRPEVLGEFAGQITIDTVVKRPKQDPDCRAILKDAAHQLGLAFNAVNTLNPTLLVVTALMNAGFHPGGH